MELIRWILAVSMFLCVLAGMGLLIWARARPGDPEEVGHDDRSWF